MDKVISSSITRSFNKSNRELYELLKVVPATPIIPKPVKLNTCEFQPRNDKQYIPKKKTKHKVKTVRDIRNLFEKDILNELPAELEKQQTFILRKIKGGSLNEEKTKSLARSMLNCDKPVTKSTWQMVMNINPENHTHSMQYVLWNGKPIRVNGSRGGKNKFICKYDLGGFKETMKKKHILKKKICNKKKTLLCNSLSVDFKPGPLTRKKFLDNSYQKYHVGHIDVINLPRPGLEIQPLYGSSLDPTITSFVNKLRDENGTISQKWAEFAVSVLGNVNGSNLKQINQNNSVTFDLSYKHDQTRLIMRRALDNDLEIIDTENNTKLKDSQLEVESNITPEVRLLMERLLDAVEINIMQDSLCNVYDEERNENVVEPQTNNGQKEKLKRRYCELDRLAVTVIRLDENESGTGVERKCNHSFCALGCICNSLQSTITLKGHCGRIDCMFECRCDFSKYTMVDAMNSECPELLPGLFNLNKEISSTLSKEEQKFHQTVIVNGDKSILLKSEKRNCKTSKKYEEYYKNFSLKSKSKVKPILTIAVPKLYCENIEPWCMVHNLYKCFCKGTFTETWSEVTNDSNKKSTEECIDVDAENDVDKDDSFPNSNRSRQQREKNQGYYYVDSDDSNTCARLEPFKKRKYSDDYYVTANSKIQEMEIDDSKLRKRLHRLINNSSYSSEHNNLNIIEVNDTEIKQVVSVEEETQSPPVIPQTSNHTADSDGAGTKCRSKITMIDESSSEKCVLNKPRLVAWLESNYQQYKRRMDMGVVKNTLEPPKKGKIALYPWDFILKRYSERKNLFLVSKQPPYRIFMAVNINNPLFENCINIDDIRFAKLNNYPGTVKNLLTNTNNMKDYFCILYGYNHCWEFIGTVTKVSDQKDEDLNSEIPRIVQKGFEVSDGKSSNLLVNTAASIAFPETSPTPENTPNKSKWFIMTVENDFSEIQFFNRGFFVKYDSIIKAIDVARMSAKTVRLSSQKCADHKRGDTQFGLYAIPNTNEYCVFIGPYEIQESLGIETIKTISSIGKRKRTRGVWITTDKVDNLKVIDNPLSFIPSQRSEYNDLISMENNSNDLVTPINDNVVTENVTQVNQSVTVNKPEVIKTVKPIKIRKSNGYYHLGSGSLLKTVSSLEAQNIAIRPKKLILNPKISSNLAPIKSTTETISVATKPSTISGPEDSSVTSHPQTQEDVGTDSSPVSPETGNPPAPSLLPLTCAGGAIVKRVQSRPVAEVAPQIKIAAVYSECDAQNSKIQSKRKEGGMFVLKPEEINQRLVIDGNKSPKASSSKFTENSDHDLEMDIENFLDTSSICPAPENETFVISDDEDSPPNIFEDEVKEIYIECTNIKNLGALKGEMNSKGIRFDFPCSMMSDYYPMDEAFAQINQKLSRKVHIPKNLNLEWHIVESFSSLKSQRLLKADLRGVNLIMTEEGIKEKEPVKTKVGNARNVKTYLNKNKKPASKDTPQTTEDVLCEQDESSLLFKKESQSLEEESHELFLKTMEKRNVIATSIAEASDTVRERFISALKDIEISSNSED